jgi:hypothetical protein
MAPVAKEKVLVNKTVTIGLDEVTIKSVTDAAKRVDAPSDVYLATGGGVPKGSDTTEYYPFSVTLSWSEEV